MGINTGQLKKYTIIPILTKLDLYSPSAVNLLLGTAAQESRMGEFLHQVGGPALGIFQMEPATHDDIVNNFLLYKRDLLLKVINVCGVCSLSSSNLENNLSYASALARIHYLRVKEALPHKSNIDALAAYWKKYYNTPLGKGTEEDFVRNYHRYVGAEME